MDRETLRTLRSHIEHWKVHRNATKMVPDLRGVSHEERKEVPDLPTWEVGSIWADMRTIYKFLRP